MKNLKTIIFTACALFSLGAVASTEHTTGQSDEIFEQIIKKIEENIRRLKEKILSQTMQTPNEIQHIL